MRTTGAALILVLLLSTTVCQGEENRVIEKDDPATAIFDVGIVYVIFYDVASFMCYLILCQGNEFQGNRQNSYDFKFALG